MNSILSTRPISVDQGKSVAVEEQNIFVMKALSNPQAVLHGLYSEASTMDLSKRAMLRNACSELINHNVCLTQPTHGGVTFAHLAAKMNDVELLHAFVAQGGNIDAYAIEADRPLNVALVERNKDVQRHLLRLGAHVDAAIGDFRCNAFAWMTNFDEAGEFVWIHSLTISYFRSVLAEANGIDAVLPLRCLCAKEISSDKMHTNHLSPVEKRFLRLHTVREESDCF